MASAALWPCSAERIFIISQFWKICGFSRIAFSREGSWRKTAFAAPLSVKARRCGKALLICALSVFASQIHLSQRERQEHYRKLLLYA